MVVVAVQLRSSRPNCGTYNTAEIEAHVWGQQDKIYSRQSPAIYIYTQQTLRQRGGTGKDGHSHIVDWTLSVAAIVNKKMW